MEKMKLSLCIKVYCDYYLFMSCHVCRICHESTHLKEKIGMDDWLRPIYRKYRTLSLRKTPINRINHMSHVSLIIYQHSAYLKFSTEFRITDYKFLFV